VKSFHALCVQVAPHAEQLVVVNRPPECSALDVDEVAETGAAAPLEENRRQELPPRALVGSLRPPNGLAFPSGATRYGDTAPVALAHARCARASGDGAQANLGSITMPIGPLAWKFGGES
jgi:hypothetical protein